MDASGNFYTEANASSLVAPSNNGVVLVVTFTLSGNVKDCSTEGQKAV